MPQGGKSSHTDKQQRQAEHIKKGYEKRGVSKDEAERRAWATLDKETAKNYREFNGKDDTKSSQTEIVTCPCLTVVGDENSGWRSRKMQGVTAFCILAAIS